MKDIKFYSVSDMSTGWTINDIIHNIENKAIREIWSTTHLINFFNTLKFMEIKEINDYLIKNVEIDIRVYEREIRKICGIFVFQNQQKIIEN